MKLGFIAWSFSEELLIKAAKMGYDCLEMCADIDTSLSVAKLTDDNFKFMAELCEKHGVSFASISSHVKHMIPDAAARKENMAYFIKLIQNAHKYGSNIVNTNVWADEKLPPAENIYMYKQVFVEYAKAAEDAGVRIVFENCPHASALVHEYPITIGNIGYSPEMWDMMFDAVPSKSIGIEFDPSHCVWMQMDHIRIMREFKDRIYACHAKDTEIDHDLLSRIGNLLIQQSPRREGWHRHGWWRYRMPGLGEIDWVEFIATLFEIGFDGPVFVEHEDSEFSGDRHDLGLKMSSELLLPLLKNDSARYQ